MRILVSGATGLIGSKLASELEDDGHDVVSLVRREADPKANEVRWDPQDDVVDTLGLEGADAVVHLAGEPIVGRWTKAKKRRIRRSRVEGTQLLTEALAELVDPPDVLVAGSAVGYYGDRGDDPLYEDSPPGDNYLAEVCQKWEAATAPAAKAGIRVVNLRTAIVLSTEGGALAKMLLPFKLGVGGPIGRGEQYFPWITRDDMVGVIRHAIEDPALDGPVNVCSPEPVTNYAFTKELGAALNRPAIIPIPPFMLRLMYGQMADQLLMASARLYPKKLIASGYKFRHPTLPKALRAVLS